MLMSVKVHGFEPREADVALLGLVTSPLVALAGLTGVAKQMASDRPAAGFRTVSQLRSLA